MSGRSFFTLIVCVGVIWALLLISPYFQVFSLHRLLGDKQWEYRVENIPDNSFSKDMNLLGGERWELVSARRALSSEYGRPASYEIIFKREKR
jgi:hypothetical protein